MRRPLIRVLAVVALVLLSLAGCQIGKPTAGSDDDYGAVADFSLTERSGRTVRRADLLGKVWVAAFTFTRCAGPCAQVSGNLARLQQELAGQDDVLLVSFTVDPEHDTPKVLQEYANRYGADPQRWLFLTGQQDDVYQLIRDSFRLGVEQTEGTARIPGNEVIHSTKLAVVDRRGHLRGYFDGRMVDDEGKPAEDLPRLKQKIAMLVGEQP